MMENVDIQMSRGSLSCEGYVTGGPRMLLRIEGAAVLILAVLLYRQLGYSWIIFAAVFFMPDVSFVAYRAGPAVGAIVYNALHTISIPIGLGLLLHVVGVSPGIPLIWAGHIGFDRMLGYGLKYSDSFSSTHLGPIGRGTQKRG